MADEQTSAPKRKGDHLWKRGQSGNPKGRPPGSGHIGKLREELKEHTRQVCGVLFQKVMKEGCVKSAQLLLDRTFPVIRPTDEAINIALPDTGLSDQARAVLAAMGQGVITPMQAAEVLGALGNAAKAIEVDELAKRVADLEAGDVVNNGGIVNNGGVVNNPVTRS